MRKLRVEFFVDKYGQTAYQDVECESIVELSGMTYFLTSYTSGTVVSLRADNIVFAYRSVDIKRITPYARPKNNTPDSDYID